MSRTPVPAAASKTIRARSAGFLGVVCARTQARQHLLLGGGGHMGSADRRAPTRESETNLKSAMTPVARLTIPARQLAANQPDILRMWQSGLTRRPWSRCWRRAALA